MFTLIKENQINPMLTEAGNVSSTISVAKSGTIKDIRINTTLVNDASDGVSIKVTSPSGTELILMPSQGVKNEGLLSYSAEALASFIGEQAGGTWQMISPGSDDDTIAFTSWGIEIDCEEYGKNRAEVFIPQKDSEQDLVSTQQCRFHGRLVDIEVDIEIEHPLIGDLIVTLVTPGGREVVLHDRAGGSQDYLKKQYTGGALDALKGESVHGEWKLRVKNMHHSGDGMLKHWKIKFSYEAEDDLKVIEGVGPKIEELIKNAGIYTYVDLATTPADQIRDILATGGDRFRMHDPETWPKQASLAAQGRWEELDQLKEALDGGRV